MQHAISIALLLFLNLHPTIALGQEADASTDATGNSAVPILHAEPAERGIQIDGVLDEPAWDEADAATGFRQYEPTPGAAATLETSAHVLYDGEAIYVGARLYDPHADSIVARFARRDQEVHADWFYVSFDSYNNNRTAFAFGVNARGIERDYLISDDTDVNADWDAVWTSAARVDSLGWTLEMRIPLSQLRYSLSEGKDARYVWGVNFRRFIARYDETDTWAPLVPSVERRVSRFGTLAGLRGLDDAPLHLEVRPYVIGRLTRAPGNSESPFYQANEPFATIGGDLEYGLTPNLTLSATINPDFGQVEADPSQINLTAFETFFPEKRPFFLEGASIFGVIEGPPLFYSRRIGRNPQGATPSGIRYADRPRRTTILGAAKLTGQTRDGWTIGALEAVTAEEHVRYVDTTGTRHTAPVEPLTNYAVARISKDLRNGRSALGGIFTAVNRPNLPEELNFLHSAAYTGGFDGRHRFSGGIYEISASVLGSYVRGSKEAIARTQRSPVRYFQRPDAEHLSFDPTRTSLSGWSADLAAEKISGNWQWGLYADARSPGFAIGDLGFHRRIVKIDSHVSLGLSRVGILSPYASLSYRRYEEGGVFRQLNAGVNTGAEWTFGGERTHGWIAPYAGGELANYWNLFSGVIFRFPALSVTKLRGGPAFRTGANSYAYVGFNTDARKALQFDLFANYRKDYGTSGYGYAIWPGLSYQVTPRLELSLEPQFDFELDPGQYVATRTASGEPIYVFGRIKQRTLSMTIRADYALSKNLSLQLYAQPFLSAGQYDRFKHVTDPKASSFDARFARFGEQLSYTNGTYHVDLDRDGAEDFSFANPDFNFKQLRSTLVLRWEYRPGSTFFFVWSHGQTASAPYGTFDLDRDLGDLFGAEATNTFLIKFNYWFGL